MQKKALFLAPVVALAAAAPAFADTAASVTEATASMGTIATAVTGFATAIGGVVGLVISGMVALMSFKTGFRILRKGTGG